MENNNLINTIQEFRTKDLSDFIHNSPFHFLIILFFVTSCSESQVFRINN